MKRKLMIPVVGLALIILGMFAATLWVTQKQKDEGLVINLAGRQRMLTQKMTKETLHFYTNWYNTGMDEGSLGQKVKNTMEVFDRTLNALTHSGEAPLGLDLANTTFRFCPQAEEPAFSQLITVGDLWSEFSKNLNAVVDDPANAEPLIPWILENNLTLLKEMNAAVTMMQTQSEKNVKRLVVLQISGIILALICVTVFFMITVNLSKHLQTIIDTLRESAGQVANNSSAIADSSQTLANGATRQAASIEQSSAAIEEMSAMTRQNAENSDKANTLMKDTNQDVERANTSMDQLIRSMDEISSASEETSRIIKTIDEVAFQTNLLALNAAVEAARAGEAGAGFAVVADEVRNLATRAAEAAKNTAQLIEETVEKVTTGTDVVNSANETFKDVIDSSRKVGQLIEEIAAASSEQAEGIGQINQAISEVDDVIQKTAAISEESASSAEETNAQVAELNRIISELANIVETGSSGLDINTPSEKTQAETHLAITQGAPSEE